MSIKRIVGITSFGILFIAAVIGVMFLTSYLRRDSDVIPLPEAPVSSEPPGETTPEVPDRIELTTETLHAIVSTLSRPDTYSRDVEVTTYWEDGQAVYHISVYVTEGMTSLRIISPINDEKRIIITQDALYIWYKDDPEPYIGDIGSTGDDYRTSDEWQMLVTYEDLLALSQSDIIETEYIEFGGEDCIYAKFQAPLLGYTKVFYVSVDFGLLAAAEEYDRNGALVYTMTAGECAVGEADPEDFTLPDGTILLQS